MTVGERIKFARKDKKISQTDLANACKISKQTLYKYENNIITNIPSDKIEAIANYLFVSPAYLMGWDNEKNLLDRHLDKEEIKGKISFNLSDHEKQVILAYRSKPEMQNAIDTLLNVPSLIEVKSAARSSDYHEMYTEKISADQLKLLQSQKQPSSDDEL